MRFAFPFAAAALVFLASGHARAEDGNYVVFGGGLNMARFILDAPSGVRKPTQSNRVAAAALMGYETTDDGRNASMVSLGYESRGAVWDGGTDDITLKFDYFQFAYQYKIQFELNPSARIYLAPGIGAGILLNSEAESGGDTEDVKNVNSFDLELSGALGVHLPVGRNAWYLEGGYGYGLLDTDDGERTSVNNSVIKLRVGFLLGV